MAGGGVGSVVAVKEWIIGAMAVGAVAIAGCGSSTASRSKIPGAGEGIAYGLRAAGMRRCAGPISGRPVIAGYNDQPMPVSLSVYAKGGFIAAIVTGPGAQEHSIGLVERHFNTASAPSETQLAATERAWRREALESLHAAGVSQGPCASEPRRLPELAPLQIVCSDQLLIPFGQRSAADTYGELMGKLVFLAGHPAS